jgi:hypothetical protein
VVFAMRPLSLAAALALAAPPAFAQEPPHVRPAPAPRSGHPAAVPRPVPRPIQPGIVRPPPFGFPRPLPPGRAPGYPYAPYYPYRTYPYGYGYSPYAFAPLWLGFGLGWSYSYDYAPYYPTYPAPYVEPAPDLYAANPPPPPPPEPDRITTQLQVRGGAQNGGATGGIEVAIDGRRLGFQAGIDAISVKAVTGSSSLGSEGALGWGTVHLTWSVVSGDGGRLRLELGGSLLSMPNSGALVGRPYAGDVAIGPNFGTSGTARIIGPLGLEAHARVTPVPVAVGDVGAALALRGGPLALAAGWRWFDVAGNNTSAPQLHFSGPELGLSFVF